MRSASRTTHKLVIRCVASRAAASAACLEGILHQVQHAAHTQYPHARVQISTASGFMRMAHATLRMLLDLVKHAPVCRLFLSASLPTHAAYIVLHLLTQMLGERADDVTTVTGVDWQPGVVLVDILAFATSLARHDQWVQVRFAAPASAIAHYSNVRVPRQRGATRT